MRLINGVLDIELFRYGTRGPCRSDQGFMSRAHGREGGKKSFEKINLNCVILEKSVTVIYCG